MTNQHEGNGVKKSYIGTVFYSRDCTTFWTRMEKEIVEAQKNMALKRRLEMFIYGRIFAFKLSVKKLRGKFESTDDRN